ncbi:hypothetical protein [Hyphomicrobium sp. 802]|uniref:hypothetical protein n=1 Tax=Hyphomicrobium sp. 802 TaxID=1112272 RepID=UPI0004B773AB|nr:hypothetical protein [Hyphomicrobium sp. 802]
MTKPEAKAKDTRTQRQKFIDAAKEHGADGDKDAFRSAVRKIAKPSKKIKD